MRVNPYSNNVSVDQLRSASESTRGSTKAPAAPAAPAAEETGLSRSTELNRYLSALRELPEVRDDAVAAASAKLESADFFSNQSASETASAIDELAT